MKKNTITWIIVIVCVGVLAWMYFRSRKSDKSKEEDGGSGNGGSSGGSVFTDSPERKPVDVNSITAGLRLGVSAQVSSQSSTRRNEIASKLTSQSGSHTLSSGSSRREPQIASKLTSQSGSSRREPQIASIIVNTGKRRRFL